MDSWILPEGYAGSIAEAALYNRLYIVTRKCRFCEQFFHEVSVGHQNFEDHTKGFAELKATIEPLVTYPVSKTKFEAKNVPEKVTNAFNEAERCRSVGSLTGTGSCLRKAIYSLCDEKGVDGIGYRERIGNLPVKETYKELLKQIKWLGGNTTKPGEENYTMEMADVALEILPILIDDMYIKDEKTIEAAKLLAKARSAKKPRK